MGCTKKYILWSVYGEWNDIIYNTIATIERIQEIYYLILEFS